MLRKNIVQHDNIFSLVKEIPAVDVAQRFGLDLQKKGQRWVTRCPVHEEKTPSFHLYRERFKCFGCGWTGDAVALVGELFNVEPLEAAREIARVFGIDTGGIIVLNRGAFLKKQKEQKRKRAVDAAFKKWRDRTFFGISFYLRACENILGADPDLPGYAAACHLQPKLEYMFEVLSGPSVEDQVKLFEEYGWGWCN